MKILMIVFLIALMAAADANVIKPSINTNIPFQFSLYNDVGYDLGIYWIDYRGVITYVDLIQAGDTLVKNSNLNNRFFLSTDGLYTEFEDIFLGHEKFKQKNSRINISFLKTPIHLYGQKSEKNQVTTAESVTVNPNPNSDYQAKCEFQFNREILNIHNRLRGKHHTSPVGLDTALTNAAQTHATSMAVKNAGMLNAGLFENLSLHGLFSKPADCSSLAKSVGEMYESSEKSYDFSNPGFTLAAGTFSQVVWKSNKLLGCGVAFSSPEQTGMINAYTVCKYQTGNIMGQFEENVLPA